MGRRSKERPSRNRGKKSVALRGVEKDERRSKREVDGGSNKHVNEVEDAHSSNARKDARGTCAGFESRA